SFIFPFANHGKISARLISCRSFIEIDRDFQFLADTFPEPTCTFDRFLPANVAYRNEWTNVCGAHPWMSASVLAHVDEFRGLFYPAKYGLNREVRISNKRHHRPVRSSPGINIQQ